MDEVEADSWMEDYIREAQQTQGWWIECLILELQERLYRQAVAEGVPIRGRLKRILAG